MQTRRRELFTTIRTEGALLPPDLLQRIADGDRELEGLTPEAYHLAANERLGEVITRSWNRLVGAWPGFRESLAKLPESDHATSATRERWLLILFQELGYGRLSTARAVDLDGKSYPVSHAWGSVPIHLVGARIPLDRRTAGVAGAAGVSPHGLLQELLNRSEERLWGVVSNGLALRVLRDNSSLTRQAYVEFDLEAMMDGEVYSDFVVLWLLCHQSRVEGERPEHCWLERWSQLAVERGTRALESLRAGVEEAIAALGRGFLAHPQNRPLRDALRSGQLSTDDYYRQLLRLVYRLLFLFVAEDRELLLAPDASPVVQERYARFFSTQRLRRIAERRRGGKHADLYEGLGLVTRKLGEDDGCPELGLPALGSFLWSADTAPDLDRAELVNEHLLEAVRALAFIEEGGTRRAVDYKNLGSEELGSVYESLLELHPEVNVDAATFELRVAAGHERRTTGSYYTPTSLINVLLDSTLDPVLDETAHADDPEEAILALTVCDPACGSGHFLVAAAHRIARRLASVRTGDEEPAPEETRRALRDVIGRCLYGVDLNPMAVELCKVALWMEAIEPGRPLNFLDSHIRCGNSLIGATPDLIADGVPDTVLKAIEGEDKNLVAELKRRNSRERGGQLEFEDIGKQIDDLERLAVRVEDVHEDSIGRVHEKERLWEETLASSQYERAKRTADAWCVAALQHKGPELQAPITQRVVRAAALDDLSPEAASEIDAVVCEYAPFHWHFEFPWVFGPSGRGGFDVCLGNPPWETLSPDAKEFFSAFDVSVRFAKKADQQTIINSLLEDEAIAAAWSSYRRRLFATVRFLRWSGRYRLFAPGNLGKGDFDSYRMFVELVLGLVRQGGMAAQVVKSGLYNGANAQAIRKELLERWRLELVLGFVNTGKHWFPGIHAETRFAVYAARRGGSTESVPVSFGIADAAQLAEALASVSSLSVEAIRSQSPDTLAIPETLDPRDAEIAQKLYARRPAFGDASGGPPLRTYQREVDMGTDRDLFGDFEEGLPLYEGRMIEQFDYRAKAYRSGRGRAAVWEPLSFGHERKAIIPQWRVPRERVPRKLGDRWRRYRVAFCDVATPTAPRSLVAALVPPNVICGHKAPTISFPPDFEWAYMPWLAVANSLCLDYLARKKIALQMAFSILDSLPFPRWTEEDPTARRLGTVALRLSCTGPEMAGYWNMMAARGWCEPVPDDAVSVGLVDEAERALARAEIDAVVARDVFGLFREELEFVLDTFVQLARAEERAHGEYRTRRLVLELYDRLGVSMPEAERREEPAEGVVLPFPVRRVARPGDDGRESLVPIYTLRAAAGAFGSGEAVEPDGWAELNGQRRALPGMFVAQVRGRSMEPRIPDGAWCLFASPVEGSRDGRILLVEHRAIDDPDNGGSYTVKRYRSRKQAVEGELWEHEEIVLEPLNPEYEPIVLRDVEDNEFRVIAELVEVIS
jgi:hypothetical protein